MQHEAKTDECMNAGARATQGAVAEHETRAEDDLDILLPDREVEIDGKRVTVKEFSFIQGLKAMPYAAPILKDLEHYFMSQGGAEPSLDDLGQVFGAHADAFLHLMMISTGQPMEWFEGLSDMEGRLVMMTFWQVNSHFFTSRLVLGAIARQAARARLETDRQERENSTGGEK